MADFLQAARSVGWRGIVIPFAVGMSAYHLIFAWVSYPIGEIHRPLHLMLALVVLFCVAPKKKLEGTAAVARDLWDILLVICVICGCGYLIVNAYEIQERVPYITDMTPTEIVLSFVTVFVVMEAARRVVGWGLVILAVVFMAYALFGDMLPEPFDHRRYSVGRIMESIYLTKEGLWNIPLGVSANYIFIFVLFGSLLLASGAGTFFTDFAQALTGRYTGGTAKTAVVSSSFMGMLQGSSVSNVVTTGSFTIPAMRKSGYSAPFAAGVEAVASSGGQLTPPILGSAAFLMVEFIGVPYLEVIKASVIPAILYYLAVFMMVDLEARRLGLKGLSTGDASIWPMLRQRGYLMIPPIAILYFLFEGFTPTMAGFWAFVSLAVLCLVMDGENRRNFLHILYKACLEAPKLIGPVAVACAVGGIIAGVTLTTGLGLKVSKIILMASGGYLSLTLFMTLGISIILGMGMPTSGAYIVLAALLAPGVVNLGVPEMAAHLFIIFAAASASITPPVAIASYAAAAVANTNPWDTSIIALKLGLSVFIIPFMFVDSPALLGVGSWGDILLAMAPASVGIMCLSVAVIGYLKIPLNAVERAGFFLASLLFIYPDWTASLAGLLLVALTGALIVARLRRQRDGEPA
jgi:TRAP transporter 4TM/12TM fusion protein